MTEAPLTKLPTAILDDRLAFVGTSGSGKTFGAGTAVERLLDTGARVVIVDPLDVWWGLRALADGKTAAYPIVIFGGAHGDLPLNEHAGALIGETVAGMAESCIVSLGGFNTKASERRFMLAFLEALYRRATGEPFHLIFDEADLWAPQKSSEPMLQNLMEQIVRRGRVKGFIPWLISQRPAVLSKDVLSQADTLIAMKLTSSQDRDAIGSWIEGQGDKAEEKRIRAELPAMQRGSGILWAPGHGILQPITFPLKKTYDSSRTPKRGEKKRATATLAPVNLEKLKERLSTIEDDVKANDPKALKAELAKLRAQIAKAPQAAPAVSTAEIERRAFVRGKIEANREFGIALAKSAERIANIGADLNNIAATWNVEVRNLFDAKAVQAPEAQRSEHPPVERRVAGSSPAGRANPKPQADPNAPLDGAALKLFEALRAHSEIPLTWPELCVLAGMITGNGYFYGGKKRLVDGFHVHEAEGGIVVLQDPAEAIKGKSLTSAAVVRMWQSKVGAPGSEMLEVIAAHGGKPVAVDVLAREIGKKPGNGYWYGGVARLKGANLIDQANSREGLRAAAILHDGRLA